MEHFLSFIERRTEAFLTHRKAVKQWEADNRKPRTFLGELWGWIDALLFAIIVVILINQYLFQLFVIPSPSMVHTLEIGDRVFVGKNSYGTELYSAGKKIFTDNRKVHRDNIITFYNPEYPNKGVVFNVLSQFIYSGTFTLVNIDRNEDGSPAERLLVKRAVGFPGEVVRFDEGNVSIRKAGSSTYEAEEAFRADAGLSTAPHRSVDSAAYPGIKAWGTLAGYRDSGLDINLAPQYIKSAYQSTMAGKDYPDDFYQFEESRTRAMALLNPADSEARSAYAKYANGIYVGRDQVLPLGDNRDDSRDGRYFGPVWQKNVNGRVLFRFWPLHRISYLANK